MRTPIPSPLPFASTVSKRRKLTFLTMRRRAVGDGDERRVVLAGRLPDRVQPERERAALREVALEGNLERLGGVEQRALLALEQLLLGAACGAARSPSLRTRRGLGVDLRERLRAATSGGPHVLRRRGLRRDRERQRRPADARDPAPASRASPDHVGDLARRWRASQTTVPIAAATAAPASATQSVGARLLGADGTGCRGSAMHGFDGQTGRNFGSEISASCFSNTTSTGMPIATFVGSTSTTLLCRRGPSSSSTMATLKGSSQNAGCCDCGRR